MDNDQLKLIHECLLTDRIEMMYRQIQKYGLDKFWNDYYRYLEELYPRVESRNLCYKNAVVSYFLVSLR